MYVVRDESTGLFLNERFGGRSERIYALCRLENVVRQGLGDATRMCRAASLAHRGHAFAVVSEDDARARARPDFAETAAFPESVTADDLSTFMHTLNGGTWPLVGVIGARLYVLKRGREPNRSAGANPGHVANEAAADAFCRAAGLKVPASRLYSVDGDVVRLSEYVTGAESLSRAWARAGAGLRRRLRDQLCAAYPIELLLANEDIFRGDNILVDAAGTAWFVDNGAAFGYRSLGGEKTRASGFAYDYATRTDPDSPVFGWTSLARWANVPDGIFYGFGKAEILRATARYPLGALVAGLDAAHRIPALEKFAAAMETAARAAAATPPAASLTSAERTQIARAQKTLFTVAKSINKHIEKKDYRPELQRMEDLDLARVVFEKLAPKAPQIAAYLARLEEIEASRANGWRTRIGEVPRFEAP
ncbi:MAG: hypothetical protein ACI4Q3_06435 [Kiritimatiellia bacterium]